MYTVKIEDATKFPLDSLRRRANARNVSFGQFTSSTQLIKPNYTVYVLIPTVLHNKSKGKQNNVVSGHAESSISTRLVWDINMAAIVLGHHYACMTGVTPFENTLITQHQLSPGSKVSKSICIYLADVQAVLLGGEFTKRGELGQARDFFLALDLLMLCNPRWRPIYSIKECVH